MLHPDRLQIVGRSVNIDHMDPETMARFYAAQDSKRIGWRLAVVSAARTKAQQTHLYEGYKAHKPGFNLAANPDWQRPDGSYGSRHMVQATGYAYALDLRCTRGLVWRIAHLVLKGFGLRFTVKGENWHAQALERFASGRSPSTPDRAMRPSYWPVADKHWPAIDKWANAIGVASKLGARAHEPDGLSSGWNELTQFVEDCRRIKLRRGDHGPPVKFAQQLLNNHNASIPKRLLRWQVLDTDGVFGPATETAVRIFQHDEDLVSDGIIGQRTWVALLGQ